MFEIPQEIVDAFYKVIHWFIVYRWIILGLIVAFAIFFISICKFERRYIHDFEPADESKLPNLTFYTREMNEKAEKLGFQFCSWYKQKRGGLYRGIAATWMSPDKLILLVVGGGKIAGINYKTTCLYSKLIGEVVLVTSDEIGEVDISGVIAREWLLNADLEELYKLHKSKLKMWKGNLKNFNKPDVLGEYEALERRRVNVLIDKGFARWVNKLQEQWRYSIKGSIVQYFSLRREHREMKKQKNRIGKRRPGESTGGFAAMGTLGRFRDLLMSPGSIVKDAGVKPGSIVLDFGCGDWSCSIEAAEAAGEDGKVYALDMHPDACAEVERRAKKKNLKNIKTIRSECATGLSNECIDIVFLHEVLHTLWDKKHKVLKELHRVLKDDGVLSLSDHHMKKKEIIADVTGGGLFKILKMGEDLHKFTKERC